MLHTNIPTRTKICAHFEAVVARPKVQNKAPATMGRPVTHSKAGAAASDPEVSARSNLDSVTLATGTTEVL